MDLQFPNFCSVNYQQSRFRLILSEFSKSDEPVDLALDHLLKTLPINYHQ